jgi:hypothetical protein
MGIKSRKCELIELRIVHRNKNQTWLHPGVMKVVALVSALVMRYKRGLHRAKVIWGSGCLNLDWPLALRY